MTTRARTHQPTGLGKVPESVPPLISGVSAASVGAEVAELKCEPGIFVLADGTRLVISKVVAYRKTSSFKGYEGEGQKVPGRFVYEFRCEGVIDRFQHEAETDITAELDRLFGGR